MRGSITRHSCVKEHTVQDYGCVELCVVQIWSRDCKDQNKEKALKIKRPACLLHRRNTYFVATSRSVPISLAEAGWVSIFLSVKPEHRDMSGEAAGEVYNRTEKEKKYDRQMRMWGSHGQKSLESAAICMLGSGPIASETLKNLVLPCIGSFTIVDDALVTPADLGNNFFVSKQHLGQGRAEVVKNLLLEMNDEVKGQHRHQNPVDLIAKNISFFNSFNTVIVANIPDRAVQALAQHLWKKGIPLVILKSYGMLGYARLCLREHPIVETHPEGDTYDLFLHPEQLAAFPELQKYIAGWPLIETLDQKNKGEIPFIAILVQAMDMWKKQHGGKMPASHSEQFTFKDMVRDMGTEENFDEAVEHAKRIYTKFELRDEVKQVFEHPKCTNLDQECAPFWFMARACLEFFKKEGKGNWPCSANIPDMTTSTKNYVEVQEIYKIRAERDAQLVHQHVQTLLKQLKASHDISLSDVQLFCKNVRQVGVVMGRSLEEEYNPSTANTEYIKEEFEDFVYREEGDADDENAKLPNPQNLHWYFALRAADLFQTKHGRFPGTVSKELVQDKKELVVLQKALFKELELTEAVDEACLAEVVRAGPSELHNVASIMGGIGSQMALKLAIQQYYPLQNTFIFNGLHGSGSAMKL
eukprot:g63199.t1